jgi:hypothetical protein
LGHLTRDLVLNPDAFSFGAGSGPAWNDVISMSFKHGGVKERHFYEQFCKNEERNENFRVEQLQ